MLKTDGGIRSGDMFPYWPQNATRIELFGTNGLMMVGRHGGGWQVVGWPKSRKPVVVEERYEANRLLRPEYRAPFLIEDAV